MKLQLLTALFIIYNVSTSYAHRNKIIHENYGNVKILFKTGYYYEEINKSLIIGEYSEMLSKKLGYNSQITLWFNHDYSNKNKADYEVNYNNNEIFIKMRDSSYNAHDILSLLEYSILNIDSVKNWNEDTIMRNRDNSSLILNQILNNKIYRPCRIEEVNKLSKKANYYYQNNKFHFFNIKNGQEEVFLSLDNVFQLSDIDKYSYFLFSSINDFYFVPIYKIKNISKAIEIKNTKDYYEPHEVNMISKELISITLKKYRSNEKERVALYDQDKQVLIQDISSYYN